MSDCSLFSFFFGRFFFISLPFHHSFRCRRLVAAVPDLLLLWLAPLSIWTIHSRGMHAIRRVASFAGFLKSRRDRRKEKDKDKKVSKKKRDSDASSVKSDGEPSLTASGGVLTGNLSSGSATTGGGGGGGGVSGQDSSSSSFGREKERQDKDESPLYSTADVTSDSAVKVDDEGYTIRPRDEAWNAEKTSGFYSSSDADSGNKNFPLFLSSQPPGDGMRFVPRTFDDLDDSLTDDEPERKLHVEIKPITNGSNLPSATVDELKATIEGFNINTSSMFNTVVSNL